MLPSKLAFVDIETTGTRVTRDRIIEIAIIRVEQGEITQRYTSLINPQCHVSPFIENYTGITQQELAAAPTFSEIMDDILDELADCVLVAHNVRFDYGFMKNEFLRHDVSFQTPHFCTVRLSRLLFPQFRRHNLDALIERFALPCANRHRAMDDTEAMWHFFRYCQTAVDNATFSKAVKQALRQPAIPNALSALKIKQLPDSPGVYIFYGDHQYPLYIGKSINLRERILSHFSSDYTSSREMEISQQVKHIETIPTPGELSALLKEAELVKQLQPLYNRKLRYKRQITILKRTTTPDGYHTAELQECEAIEPTDAPSILGIYTSKKRARDFLATRAKQHQLCQKLLQLEKGKQACFGYQLGTCTGACIQKEAVARYNLRFDLAFTDGSIKPWPFAGPICITEQGSDSVSGCVYLVDKWCILGILREGDHDWESLDHAFDVDTYKILRQFLNDPKNKARISTRIPNPS